MTEKSTSIKTTMSQDEKVVTFTLDHTDTHNALTEGMISDLTQAIVSVARLPHVGAIILTGAGDSFCAGTDISWMESLARGDADNDARRLGNLLFQLRGCPKPIIARVNGDAIGAGVGLMAACDIVVCAEEANFSLPAVRLGVVPAIIGPFLTDAIGSHQARRFMITGENFSAMDARRIGLVHAVAIRPQLDETVAGFVDNLLCGGPLTIKETKSLINEFGNAAPNPTLLDEAAKISARSRKTQEAREGLAAFVEKRPPNWDDQHRE